MRRTMLLAAALLALAGCATGMGGGAGTVAPQFIGTWTGEGTQTDPPSEWTIEAVIVGGPAQQVGTIRYPSLECGGVWVLRSVGANWLEVGEDITYGPCEDNGIITLTPMADGRLRYEWHLVGIGKLAEGTLTRVR